MKRWFVGIVVLGIGSVVFCGCSSTSAVRRMSSATYHHEDKLKIAVIDFKNQTGDANNNELTASIPGIMIDALQKTQSFRLIERTRLETVLKELNLNYSGMMDEDNAKKVGKQLGVDALLIGNLSSVKFSKSKQTIFIMWTEGQKTEVVLDTRLVNVETGEIIETAKETAFVKERSWVAFGFAKIGKITAKNAAVQTGLELACNNIAVALASSQNSRK